MNKTACRSKTSIQLVMCICDSNVSYLETQHWLFQHHNLPVKWVNHPSSHHQWCMFCSTGPFYLSAHLPLHTTVFSILQWHSSKSLGTVHLLCPQKIKWQHVAQQIQKWSWYLYTTAAQASLHVKVTQWLWSVHSLPDVFNSIVWQILKILHENCP